MSTNSTEGNMEDQTKKSSRFFCVPALWKVIRTILVMVFLIWGLLWGLPALISWWQTGHSKAGSSMGQAQDDPKVFGGGAPGR